MLNPLPPAFFVVVRLKGGSANRFPDRDVSRFRRPRTKLRFG
jgi:hypothetical protein